MPRFLLELLRTLPTFLLMLLPGALLVFLAWYRV